MHSKPDLPRRSFSLSRLVVPTIGALTPGFAMHHANAICAMLTPFFLAISSTLLEINLPFLIGV